MGTINDILKAVDQLSASDLQKLMEKLENKRIPISKNIPAVTLKAINDPDSEKVDDLRAWMNENA